jgi:cytochrome c-type biogenesis protein CcmH
MSNHALLRILIPAALFLSATAFAAIETLQFESSTQEERYHSLISELRCLVCQNQSLADSNADLAKDLRKITYDMISAGDSDDEVRKYMSDRYGDFVLYKPPLRAGTLVLWAGPFVLLIVTLIMCMLFIRRRNREVRTIDLDPAALEHAKSVLDGTVDDGTVR